MKADTQERTNPLRFARVLGKRPVLGAAKYEITDNLDLLGETFGPPERRAHKNSAIVYWNFSRDDGTSGFTLFAEVSSGRKPRELEISLAAKAGVRSFYDWTIDKLSAMEGGEETPLFIGAGKFVVCPIH